MLRTLFVAAILVPGFYYALRNRFAAVMLYLWFGLFRPQEWVWFDLTQYRVSFIIALVAIVPSLLTGILPNLTHPLSLGALAFLVMTLVSQVNAVAPDVAWPWIDFMSRLILVSLLMVTLIDSKRRFTWAVAVIAGSFGFHAAKAGLASLLGGGLRFGEGFGGAFLDNNGYAMGAVMILPLLVAVAQNVSNRWIRRAFWIAVPLTMMTVVSTFSRGGFLAMGTAALVFAGLQRRRAVWLSGLAALTLVAYLVVPIPEGYLRRMDTIQTYEDIGEDSALSRLHFWQVAFAMAKDRPFGVGLRNFEAAYDRYDFLGGTFGTGRSVHSSHFQVLAELGFGGLAIWIVLFGVATFTVLATRSRYKDPALPGDDQRFYFTMSNALAASMAGFLVGGAFIALALNDLTWLVFGLVTALHRLPQMEAATRAREAAALPRSATFRPAVAMGETALSRPESPGGIR